MRLKDKVALVTGAASGIGEASALRFAAEGASVAVVDIDFPGAKKTAAAIQNAGGRAIPVACDVSDEDQVAKAYELVADELGYANILYSNAGIPMTIPLDHLTVDQWDRVMTVNVRGAFLMSKYAVPHMERHGGGAILTTGSTVGVLPTQNRPSYAASKGAIIQFTRALAVDLGPKNIRANCVCPGAIDTPAMRTFLTNQFGTAQPIETHLAEYGRMVPLQVIGTPEDIAAAAAFLVSDDARWITGAVLMVDGGKTAAGTGLFNTQTNSGTA